MIILPQARGILRGRVFYPLQLRIEPQSALTLPGFLLLNNMALLGAQAGLTANVFNLTINVQLFPTVGLTAGVRLSTPASARFAGAASVNANATLQHLVTTYNANGSYSYVIPATATTVDVWLAGAGGGGGAPYNGGGPSTPGDANATPGGDSTASLGGTTVTARGGGAGQTGLGPGVGAAGGTGGTAVGGNVTNVTGSNGQTAPGTFASPPNNPAGGSDGLGLGIRGGVGGSLQASSIQGGGGGGPGALHHQFSVAAYHGQSITVVIGAAGAGGIDVNNGTGSAGMDGIALLSWN